MPGRFLIRDPEKETKGTEEQSHTDSQSCLCSESERSAGLWIDGQLRASASRFLSRRQPSSLKADSARRLLRNDRLTATAHPIEIFGIIPDPAKQCHSEGGAAADPAGFTAAGAPTEESGGWAPRPVDRDLPREKPRSTGCTVTQPDSSVGAPAPAWGEESRGRLPQNDSDPRCAVFFRIRYQTEGRSSAVLCLTLFLCTRFFSRIWYEGEPAISSSPRPWTVARFPEAATPARSARDPGTGGRRREPVRPKARGRPGSR
jgi:hypothetical protein